MPQPIEDPNEFERQHDLAKNYIGPREFARKTKGSRIEGVAESKVIVED
jgi:hypothetical protein